MHKYTPITGKGREEFEDKLRADGVPESHVLTWVDGLNKMWDRHAEQESAVHRWVEIMLADGHELPITDKLIEDICNLVRNVILDRRVSEWAEHTREKEAEADWDWEKPSPSTGWVSVEHLVIDQSTSSRLDAQRFLCLACVESGGPMRGDVIHQPTCAVVQFTEPPR